MKTGRIARFEKLVSHEKSGWLEKARWREENHAWLDKSALIAISVLKSISDQGINQKILAEKMEVSAQYINKIVKGSENLSLETISKLELALGIRLIEVSGLNHYTDDELTKKESMDIASESIVSYPKESKQKHQKRRNKSD